MSSYPATLSEMVSFHKKTPWVTCNLDISGQNQHHCTHQHIRYQMNQFYLPTTITSFVHASYSSTVSNKVILAIMMLENWKYGSAEDAGEGKHIVFFMEISKIFVTQDDYLEEMVPFDIFSFFYIYFSHVTGASSVYQKDVCAVLIPIQSGALSDEIRYVSMKFIRKPVPIHRRTQGRSSEVQDVIEMENERCALKHGCLKLYFNRN